MTDDAQAANVFNVIVGVGDGPEARDDLRCNLAGILDRHCIGKDILVAVRIGLVLQILCAHRDGEFIRGHDFSSICLMCMQPGPEQLAAAVAACGEDKVLHIDRACIRCVIDEGMGKMSDYSF